MSCSFSSRLENLVPNLVIRMSGPQILLGLIDRAEFDIKKKLFSRVAGRLHISINFAQPIIPSPQAQPTGVPGTFPRWPWIVRWKRPEHAAAPGEFRARSRQPEAIQGTLALAMRKPITKIVIGKFSG